MKLKFCGGAKSVTGANYLLDDSVLVDCGLNQGSSFLEKINFEPFTYDPKTIKAVLITHAHIDHIGRLPQLYKAGFRGDIFSTPPTKDFAEELLFDSENVLSKEAHDKNKDPIYNIEDVRNVMRLWKKVDYHEKFKISTPAGELEIEFFDAGHILGSSVISVSSGGKRIIFSGDLGNSPAPFIKDAEAIESADYVLIESAYGDRLHENLEARKEMLEDFIEEITKAGGTLMIPAFAMERTQELLFELNDLVENGRIPKAPVFVDSPLAIKLTSVYRKYSQDTEYFREEAIELLKKGDAIFNFPGLKTTLTTEQSKEINNVPPPKIIIAGSGMSQGGRILHHEMRYLPDPKSAILFIGYQVNGSLGRRILNGEKWVKIFGEEIPVKCKVKSIAGYSAHADQRQLLDWLRPMRLSAKKVFIVQGEEEGMSVLAQKIKDELALKAVIPSTGEEFVL
ncbi:MAG: MBL fold metallo-hydrolase [Spirochaetia bacterium]|nr:MAG: MBL fold metallo-hydrolase [Spirochaetia bacterium]